MRWEGKEVQVLMLTSSWYIIHFQMKAKDAICIHTTPSWMNTLSPTITPTPVTKRELKELFLVCPLKPKLPATLPSLPISYAQESDCSPSALKRSHWCLLPLSSLSFQLFRHTNSVWLRPPCTGQPSSRCQWDFPRRCSSPSPSGFGGPSGP